MGEIIAMAAAAILAVGMGVPASEPEADEEQVSTNVLGQEGVPSNCFRGYRHDEGGEFVKGLHCYDGGQDELHEEMVGFIG